ncbi:dipeptidase, putative [Acetomicrobium mobile DSM 13181]|uniref:Dipeptidase, putative n=1 Tax=Acetomicrobium mobile (strain ATCC BAA-54 / DSM 13181 / JCM 12221 / NGA) TaxID=891968 RepID=I4BZ27_ACEMN|nr:dipeptidase PepV [Acetomicrobium mobile]AFM22534.1 dipeptidase, putative [Acetomicrobium mobile DSM 13181]
MKPILNKAIDERYSEMVEDLKSFIRIPSVLDETTAGKGCPFGLGVSRGLEWIIEKGKQFGFRSTNLDGYVGYIEIGDGVDTIGLLTHVDVVPAGTGWSVDPFGGEIKDGKIYGRGSIDDKGPTVAVLYALKAIKESNLAISKRIRLIVGADEETDNRCIQYYLKKEAPPIYGFSPDAEFPIINAEKGILQIDVIKKFEARVSPKVYVKKIVGGTKVNMVPGEAEALIVGLTLQNILQKLQNNVFKSKLQVEETPEGLLVKAKGTPAHASKPYEGENAIQILLSFLKTLGIEDSEALDMKADERDFGISCSDNISRALTMNLGVVSVNEKRGIFKFDIRYPVTVNGYEIIEKFKQSISDPNTEVFVSDHELPLYVNPDAEFIKKLQYVYKEMTGDDPKLLSIGGGTYCRYVKNTVSFGPVFPGQKELAHCSDEHIALNDLGLIAKIYAQAIWELAR